MQNDDELKIELEGLESDMLNNVDFWADKNLAQNKIKRIAEIKSLLSGGEEYDKGNAILSIITGAGGDDAEDFSGMLLHMYKKYIENKNWQVKLIDENPNTLGGYKSVCIEVIGKNVYGTLKNESGVHRLVRISPFNSKGLRQTSFCLVEVVPVFDASVGPIQIKPDDLKIEFSKAGGPGGQNVNKRETAVRIVHIPTNIVASCATERSQEQNRSKAMSMILGKLYKKQEEDKKRQKNGLSTTSNVEIEWGSQIRSYVLHPYKLVKDHRTDVEIHDTDSVLEDGEIEALIFATKKL